MTVIFPELSQAGRLGNQLWEIASTIGIARAQGTAPSFPLWDYQPFFNVPPEFFTHYPAGSPATNFVPHMDPRARTYLQDHSLFADIEDEIRSMFSPSPQALAILDEVGAFMRDLPRPWVSIHVRRGDNVTHPAGYHPLRSMEYYQRAFQQLRGPDLGVSWSTIMFTDDPEWVRENFEDETGIIVNHIYDGIARPREYVDRHLYDNAPILDWIDLQLMARCDRHILSNSTYAWWGAFLSANRAPIYPCSESWFGYHISPWTDASLMFPSTWTPVHDDTQGGIVDHLH